MIQRIQTLFLIEIIFLGISLFFIPVQFIISGSIEIPVHLLPFNQDTFSSTLGLVAAMGINIIALIIAAATIFLYKKRQLQIKLCYALAACYVVLTLMLVLCPFVNTGGAQAEIRTNAVAYSVFGVQVISSMLAARYIKKDIELLKSADRIR